MVFVLVVSSKEAKSGAAGNPIITQAGEKFIVVNDEDEWVEATSLKYDVNNSILPPNVKIFRTQRAAERFVKRWKGYPWWCVPDGTFEVILVSRIVKCRKETIGYQQKKPNKTSLT